ncbi:hypothetical protein AB4Z40_32565, partial [Bosea sp. 2YAB26]|uniref:hypothetical protein n=1 Tax=Bosea sp. 2YAB26 TaxID=3237478 RepID=UPI003F8F0F70
TASNSPARACENASRRALQPRSLDRQIHPRQSSRTTQANHLAPAGFKSEQGAEFISELPAEFVGIRSYLSPQQLKHQHGRLTVKTAA